jgi:hypothetical protein
MADGYSCLLDSSRLLAFVPPRARFSLARSCFDNAQWTIIVSGAASNLCDKLWRWDYLKTRLKDVMHHKIKLFSTGPSSSSSFLECGWRSWLFSSYCAYLEVRERCLAYDALPVAERQAAVRPPNEIRVMDATGNPNVVNVRTEVRHVMLVALDATVLLCV